MMRGVWGRLPWIRKASGSSLLSPGILSSQDGPVLGAVGSFSWSGGAFVYPANVRPTFINMSQEKVDMRDAYLGKKRLVGQGGGVGGGQGKVLEGRDQLSEGGRSLGAEVWAPQVTPPHWPFGRGSTAWSWGPLAISTRGRLSSLPRNPGNGGPSLKSEGHRLV